MRKVIDQQIFEVKLGETPDLYTRLKFEDGKVSWVTRFGIAHEGMQKPLEEKYLALNKPIENIWEIDKIYETKFQTKEKYQIKEILKDSKDKTIGFNGVYIGREHLGNCPLNVDRLSQ